MTRRWSSARVAGLAVLALAGLLALAACKKEGDLPAGFGPRGPAVDVDKLQAPPLFAYIPADTPYVLASFEAPPLDYYVKLKRAVGPVMRKSLGQLRSLARDSELDRWLDAVLEELDGKWSAKGLESLGLSAQPRFAIYGHGALPVVARFEVKDGKALLATIERIAQRAGATLPPLENRHGREFWRIELPGDNGMIVALGDQQLAVAFGPRHAIADVMPQIVGAEKPARNMAGGEELKRLIAKHRLGPVMIGYVDTKRLAHALLALSDRTPPAECVSEIDRLAASVPRFVLSYTELTAKRFSAAAILELAPPLVEQLKALRAAVPGLSTALSGEPLFAFGAGFDLARGKTAGKAMASALRELGEACDARSLVNAARDLREAVSEPLPGPLAKISGGALSIDSIDFGGGGGRRHGGPSMPRSFEGFAMVSVSDGKAVLDALAAEAPPIADFDLKANGKLHELDLQKFGLPFNVYGGIGEHALVAAAGSRGKRQAEDVLSASGDAKSPFLAATMDTGRLMELQAQLDPATRDLNESMADLFGRTTFTLDATDAGLALWMSGEMK